ncbi:MAG: hypothetical protein O3B76_03060 [Proteobacteria bacterium]|nr:hypothetical protein [Pseudomonadota bacterium]MDA1022527.1 hypothetical protein [Pseudomonadota bacterium]
MSNLRILVMAAVVVAIALPLPACGKRASPEHPGGSSYPRQYPPAEEDQKKPSPSQSGPESRDGTVSPQGYPLEYPNRPTY